jgi:putative glycosyltransferase (TIGR04372 family)
MPETPEFSSLNGENFIGVLLRKLRTLLRMSWRQRVRRVANLLRTFSVLTATYVVYFVPGVMIAAAGYKFLPNDVARKRGLGNLLDVPAYYVKAISVGLLPRRKWIILAPRKQTVNRAVVEYWRTRFRVIESDLVCRLLTPLTRMPFVSEMSRPWPLWRFSIDGCFIENWQASYEVVRRYEMMQGTQKVFELSHEHQEAGLQNLEKLGMSRDDWYVVLHVREPGYHTNPFHRDSQQTFRNADLTNHYASIQHIVDRGGWVIRVGDPGMSVLPNLEHVIDYVHTDIFADWMDLYLAANCRFMLATTSGPAYMPGLFGRHVVVVNATPFGPGPDPDTSEAIVIPKPYYLDREHRLLSFAEVLESGLGWAWLDRIYKEHGVRLLENSPDEILDAVKEMFDRLDGTVEYTEEDERRQRNFVELRHRWDDGAAPTLTRVGRDFLRKYEDLLH